MKRNWILFVLIGVALIGYGIFAWTQGETARGIAAMVGGLVLIVWELILKRKRS